MANIGETVLIEIDRGYGDIYTTVGTIKEIDAEGNLRLEDGSYIYPNLCKITVLENVVAISNAPSVREERELQASRAASMANHPSARNRPKTD